MHEVVSGHCWAPIAELTADDRAGASEELPPLFATWLDAREALDPQQVAQFHERLQREWAIETGIIERIYTLDRGTTELLIERGIDASLIPHSDSNESPEFVAGIIADQQSAVEWLFEIVKSDRTLTTGFIKELHQLMTQKQRQVDGVDRAGRSTTTELLHGEYKRWANNPSRSDGSVHEYAPPEQVASEMDRLIELHEEHLADGLAPEVEAAWLHHRFAQIHPFQDGNGRVARALASLVLIRAGWFPLVVTDDDRSRYIDALEAADRGTLQSLIDLFATIQKRSIVRAMSIADDVRRETERVDQMIDVIGDIFGQRDEALVAEFDQAKDTASKLAEHATVRFQEVAIQLNERLAAGRFERVVFTDGGANEDSERRIWNRYQVVDTAKKLDYFANLREFHHWVRLGFDTENGRSELLLSFHAVGAEYRGLVGASMCFYRREKTDKTTHRVSELQSVSGEMLQINFKEERSSVERRFNRWLEASLVAGLDQWRRGE